MKNFIVFAVIAVVFIGSLEAKTIVEEVTACVQKIDLSKVLNDKGEISPDFLKELLTCIVSIDFKSLTDLASGATKFLTAGSLGS